MTMATWLLIGMIILVLIVVITLHGSNDRPQPPAEPKIEPPAREPMRMIQMLTTGFLRIEGPNGVQEEQVPISPMNTANTRKGCGAMARGRFTSPPNNILVAQGPTTAFFFDENPTVLGIRFTANQAGFFAPSPVRPTANSMSDP